jgi:hypothetical protein
MPYYIRYQGRKQGPLSEAQLVTLLSRGTISKDTDASLDEENWQPLGTLPNFEHLYSKIVAQQLKTVAGSASSPLQIYETKICELDDIFAKAGFLTMSLKPELIRFNVKYLYHLQQPYRKNRYLVFLKIQ